MRRREKINWNMKSRGNNAREKRINRREGKCSRVKWEEEMNGKEKYGKEKM